MERLDIQIYFFVNRSYYSLLSVSGEEAEFFKLLFRTNDHILIKLIHS